MTVGGGIVGRKFPPFFENFAPIDVRSALPWRARDRDLTMVMRLYSQPSSTKSDAGKIGKAAPRENIDLNENAPVTRKVAMAITGQKTGSVYKRYDIVSQQDMTAAREKMQRYLSNQAKVTPWVTNPDQPN